MLEALIRRHIQATGWRIAGAVEWKNIRKLNPKNKASPEARNVLGAVLDARESACAALVFSRDTDGDELRAIAIQDGIAMAESLFPEVKIVGGVARQKLEAWLLALLKVRRTESMTSPEKELELKGVPLKSVRKMVEVVELSGAPADDARSLIEWLERASRFIPPLCAATGVESQ